MLQLYAKAESLSCLLSSNIENERHPEPFRMQGNVMFLISYSEYINYVLSLTEGSDVRLSTSLDVLIHMAATSHPQLYNYFLRDVAFAVMKELYYAEYYRKQATVISPVAFNNKDVLATNMIRMFPQCTKAQQEMVTNLGNLGFTFDKNITAANADLFKIAVVLYHISLSKKPVEEMNVVYDL